MTAAEYFEPRSKKGRGMAKASLELIGAMHDFAEACQPISVRGIAYKLFSHGLIGSMDKSETQRVSRLLTQARERGMIPWEWIVDETRDIERSASWDNPEEFIRCARRSYRRDFWNEQKHRVEVWSEKGTVRGVLSPVLDEYGVGFRVLHGFSGATTVHDVANDYDGRLLIVLYVGDLDPSGMFMSARDLPRRLEKYGGDHVVLSRIALLFAQVDGLPFFDASEKQKDPRHSWFVENYGERCWELDAMDPNDLRAIVERNIKREIEPETWERARLNQEAEQESLQTFFDSWRGRR